jgi:hypothetical protein
MNDPLEGDDTGETLVCGLLAWSPKAEVRSRKRKSRALSVVAELQGDTEIAVSQEANSLLKLIF